ncbi:MAG: hypothetical protein H0X16_01030 [Chloroflexi bacterium]|nr:hypothetical protein [Chloroflexota bacterium]
MADLDGTDAGDGPASAPAGGAGSGGSRWGALEPSKAAEVGDVETIHTDQPAVTADATVGGNFGEGVGEQVDERDLPPVVEERKDRP